jgi:hypothetical protein
MSLCYFVFPLQICSAIFAAGAAGLWYWASRVKTPEKIITIEIHDGVDHVTGELDQLAKALILQSKWNARAATCAALSAACQVAAAFMPVCWG